MSTDLIQQTINNLSKSRWWIDSEKQVIGNYGKLFNPINIDSLLKEDFKSFLLIKNNLHWDGIHRQNSLITSDMSALRRTLIYFLNEEIPIKERLNEVFDKKGRYGIKGLGKAVLTPILLVVYPDKYGVWNNKSEAALKKLNLFPNFQSKDTFFDKYLKVNNLLLELSAKYQISLWQLDSVFGHISGVSEDKSVPSEEDAIEEIAQEQGVVDIVNFGMESHLEDFLIANWNKTVFGKDYNLIYKEGDLLSQQYQTDVGPIDILALSKDEKEYLVIELKKGRTSDAVVGQILRYIAWVRNNLAKDKTIKGVVIIFEAEDKLKYSLSELKNITLYTYKVDFTLNSIFSS